MQPDFRDVAIISQEIPHSASAGSLLLLRLFERWPSQSVVVAGPPIPNGARTLDCRYVEFNPVAARIHYSRFARFAWVVSVLIRATPKRLPAGRGTVVVTVMQCFAYFYAAYLFARRRGLPLVMIVHDDPEDFERQSGLMGRIYRQICKRVYRFAAKRLCVSPQMSNLLEKRYGARGSVLYPVPSADLKPRPINESAKLRRPPRLVIGYVGNVGYGYGERLDELAPVFAKHGATLRIYSRRTPTLKHHRLVEYAGSFEPEEVWSPVKRECDVLLVAYSFDPASHQTLYRSHFPSKLPEYLALAMPVIITGPEYATGVIWGLNNPTAVITICHSDESRWSDTIRQLINSSELRMDLGSAALAAGRRDFNPAKIDQAFQELVSGCRPS